MAAFVAVLAPVAEPAPTPTVPTPMWDWAAAKGRKMDAVQQLAPLTDALDDLEARIDELMARTKDLELT